MLWTRSESCPCNAVNTTKFIKILLQIYSDVCDWNPENYGWHQIVDSLEDACKWKTLKIFSSQRHNIKKN